MLSWMQRSDAVKSKHQEGGPDGPDNGHPFGRLPAHRERLVTGVRNCKVALWTTSTTLSNAAAVALLPNARRQSCKHLPAPRRLSYVGPDAVEAAPHRLMIFTQGLQPRDLRAERS